MADYKTTKFATKQTNTSYTILWTNTIILRQNNGQKFPILKDLLEQREK